MIKPKDQNWNPSVNCLKLEIALFKIILEFDSTENILLVSTTNTSNFQSQVRCTHLDQGRRKRIRYVYERSTQ